MTSSFVSKRSLRGAAVVVVTAGVVAATVAVVPSFATSFLTPKQAARTYVKKKVAENTYLTAKEAKAEFVPRGDVPPTPIVRTVASTVDTGPIFSTTPYEIPGARAVFKTESTITNVVISFSGQATCTAATNGVGCPVQLLVDGSPTGTGSVNFLTSTSASPQAKEAVRTTVQSAVVGPGKHVITARYAGAKDTSVGFKVFDWNLIAEAYPGVEVVEEETE